MLEKQRPDASSLPTATDPADRARRALLGRFGQAPVVADDPAGPSLEALCPVLERSSCRAFAPREVERDLLELVIAAGLSAPTKSDLQQADIVRVSDTGLRAKLLEGLPGAEWMARAPEFLIVCGNGLRLTEMFERTGRPFPNDHFDALFNATVDASLVLGALISAAALVGLGTCPVSQIRNEADRVDDLLKLPPRVFPVAGLCLGWPARDAAPTPRLGLAVTTHENAFGGGAGFADGLAEYEARRACVQPIRKQREVARFGTSPDYGWEEDKTRQYSEVQREGFGAYLRRKGFSMD